jgi:hypothetical protein
VTVRLNTSSPRSMTMTILAGQTSPVLFDFMSKTGDFMTMDVRRADGGQPPPPFLNFNLPKPSKGYNGALFTISVLGSFFNVSPG